MPLELSLQQSRGAGRDQLCIKLPGIADVDKKPDGIEDQQRKVAFGRALKSIIVGKVAYEACDKLID